MLMRVLWAATGGPFFIHAVTGATSHGIVGRLALGLLAVLAAVVLVRWAEIGLYAVLMAFPKISRGRRKYALSHTLLPLILAQALVLALVGMASLAPIGLELVAISVALVGPAWLPKEVNV